MIDYAGGSGDLKYHVKTLEREGFISFDRLGPDSEGWSAGPDSIRLGCIIGLIGMAYADRLMLGHDSRISWLGRDCRPLFPREAVKNWYPTYFLRM